MSAQQYISFTNDCLKMGGIAFSKASQAVGLYTQLGVLIIDVLNLNSGESAVTKQLKDLQRELHSLHQEMRKGFSSVEALIVEHSFTKNIINRVNNLQRFLENMLSTNRSWQSVDDFKHECNQRRPQTLLSDIIESIKQTPTNPVVYTVKANIMNSREIFKKWKEQIENLAGTLAMLHGIFCGLSGYGNDGTMAENCRELYWTFQHFEQTFKPDYWPDVTQLVETTMDNRTDIGNEAKADIISNALTKVFTTDYFYIIVYNDCNGYDEHSFYYEADQTLCRFRRGMCNAVVYASKTADAIGAPDYKWLQKKVEAWRDGRIPSYADMSNTAKEIFEDLNRESLPYEEDQKKAAEVCRFVGLIRKQHNPAITSTGYLEHGPGSSIMARGSPATIQSSIWSRSDMSTKMPGQDTMLIVGLP